MIAQVRLYTINKGMMESWIKLFNGTLAPLHAKYGMTIGGAWVYKQQNEFIWLRVFKTAEEESEKTKAYYTLPERLAIGDLPGQHLAKIEVRVSDFVYASPKPEPMPKAAQFRLYTVNKGMLDPFVDFFKSDIGPLHEQAGIPILSAWQHSKQNEFLWFRGYDRIEEIEPANARFQATPGRLALGDRPQSHHAKMEIRDVEYVFDPAPSLP